MPELLTLDNGLMVVKNSFNGVIDYTVMKEERLTDTLMHITPIFKCDTYDMALDFINDYEEDND